MKPAVIVTALVTVCLGALVATRSEARAPCTERGTPADDVMAGSRAADVLCSLGGDDYAHGNGGRDIIRAGSGDDALIGGKGNDVLNGRRGDDRLFAVDGARGDLLRGGEGTDQCFADRGDRVRGCEKVFRGATIREANALSAAFHGGLLLAEELLEPTVAPPVVVTEVTVTITEPFPPCENSQDSPEPCGEGEA